MLLFAFAARGRNFFDFFLEDFFQKNPEILDIPSNVAKACQHYRECRALAGDM